jgi:hypothetical protein
MTNPIYIGRRQAGVAFFPDCADLVPLFRQRGSPSKSCVSRVWYNALNPSSKLNAALRTASQ